MPLFSFVIPTRNRARYLQFALQSCLEQDFDDYEVVVSDNNSTDDTKDVVERLDNGRVRYLNTGKDLGATDNFENGVSQARGEYVLILADDEAYKTSALSRLRFWIEQTGAHVISFGRTPFVFPGLAGYGLTVEQNTAGILALRPFTRKVAWVPSSHALKIAFSLKPFEENYYGRVLPNSVKSVIHRQVIQTIVKKVGCFQLPPTPDWSSSIMILNQVERVLLVDEHIHLAGEVAESTGPNFQRQRQIDKGTAQDSAFFTNLTPVKAYTLINLCVNAILRGQEAYPGQAKYELDYERYFRLIERDLRILQNNGVDVSDDLAELDRVARGYGVKRAMPGIAALPGQKIKSLLQAVGSRFLQPTAAPDPRSSWPIVFDGRTAGFTNILECARIFDQLTETVQPDEYALSLYQSAYGSCEVIGGDPES